MGSIISQEMLNGLVIIFIERELIRNLDYENLVKKFIKKEGRKICLNFLIIIFFLNVFPNIYYALIKKVIKEEI